MSSLKYRLAKGRGETVDQSIKAPPVENKTYLDFIRSLPCVITGSQAEAAHLSFKNEAYGHLGRGKGQKASDCWALPLSPSEHRLSAHSQHNFNEADWWRRTGINPHALARSIYGTYCERGAEDARPICLVIIRKAKEFI